jgi:hypothetical protein
MWRDTDTFEITMPLGYAVDDLPPSANADYPFASYHSKTEVNGNVLRYTRSVEVKQLAVPLEQMADLKRFYQIINGDERNTAVLSPEWPNKQLFLEHGYAAALCPALALRIAASKIPSVSEDWQ